MKNYIANIITSLRIVFSAVLIFFSPFSTGFFVFYVLAGVTDMVDGTIARKLNAESEFGARLDTIADIVFVVVCLVKLIPVLVVPTWMIIWIAIIALIKIANMFYFFGKNKTLIAEHTVINKATGVMLFLVPLSLSVLDFSISGTLACAMATVAAINEAYIIRVRYRERVGEKDDN